MDFYRRGTCVFLIGLLGACSSGEGGSGSGEESSPVITPASSVQKQGSPDIYNPQAYEAVLGADDTGIYVLIQKGRIDYTLAEGNFLAYLELKTQVSRRQVIALESLGSGELRVVDLCSGQGFGTLTETVPFSKVAGEPGRYTAPYTERTASMPMLNEALTRVSPLEFTAPSPGSTNSHTLNVEVDAVFDLKRIGDLGSEVGKARLTYTVGGTTQTVENACIMQAHVERHGTMVDSPAPNEYDTVMDYVWVARSPVKLFMRMESGDTIVGGIGPVGTGKFAEFHISLDSPYGNMFFDDQTLMMHGDTGAIAQSMIGNTTWGLEFSGQATNDGSIKFEQGSMDTTYHVIWPMR